MGRLAALRLRTWLVISHLAVLALPMVVLWGTGAMNRDLERQTRRTLLGQAQLLAVHAEAELAYARAVDPGAGVEVIAPRLAGALDEVASSAAGARLLNADGVVVASTGPGVGADLSDRAEVAEALAGRIGSTTRVESPPLPALPEVSRRTRLYLAVPLEIEGKPVGAILVTRGPRKPLQVARNVATRLSGGVALAVLITAAVGVAAGWALTRILGALLRASRAIADGSTTSADELAAAERAPIVEVRVLARAFADTSARLQSRLAYIAEFASNVSHEFKTPLATLRGTVELIADDDEMPAEQRAHFLRNALEELERLDRLVSGLLTLARAEEGGRRERVDLGDLALDVAARHAGATVRAGPTVSTDGDPVQLAAALDNLVSNAFHHGGATEVTLTPWSDGERVGVDVTDNGAGISQANLARVFDRFFTTDRARGGTGLGLAIVLAVCRAHGGDVTVESHPGRTRFRIALRG